MLQNIIVYIIVAVVFAYSVYAIVKYLRKKNDSGCGDCHGCDLKNELTHNHPGQKHRNPSSCGCATRHS